MKFKVLPGSQLYDSLIKFKEKCENARSVCWDWMKDKFPDAQGYLSRGYEGGLYAIKLSQKPDGWREIKGALGYYAPKAALKAINKEMGALPRVDETELKQVLDYGNYSGSSGGRMLWNTAPAVNFGNGYILIETSEIATSYIPRPEMIEILDSEYTAMIEEIKQSMKTENEAKVAS